MSRERNPRRGLQRLECDCGAVAYATWKQVESRPLPVCGACALPFVPTNPELAGVVLEADALAAHPWVAEYQRQVASVRRGQSGPARSLRRDPARELEPPDAIAWKRVRADMREHLRAAQLAGLRRPAPELPF